MRSYSLFLLFALGAAAAAVVSQHFKQRRRRGFAMMGRQLGLEFSAVDPVGLIARPFALFQRGDDRGVENVLSGSWQGLPLHAFDYWYVEESSNAQGGRTRSYHRYNCVVTEIDAACSPLRIERENVLTRLADGLGFTDIELESEDFNRAFDVRSADRRFAYEFIDGRMMRFLLDSGHGCSFEACGPWLLTWSPRLRPTEIIPLLGTARGFTQRVPRVVFALYGTRATG